MTILLPKSKVTDDQKACAIEETQDGFLFDMTTDCYKAFFPRKSLVKDVTALIGVERTRQTESKTELKPRKPCGCTRGKNKDTRDNG